MNVQHLSALLAVELKREGPLTFRMFLAVLGLLLLFTLAGKGGAETMSAVLVGSTVGYVVLVPMALSRDKIDGSLEFLCFLPTTAREIVGARVAATALVSIPGALQIAAAFAIYGAPLGLVPNPIAATIALFVIAWIDIEAIQVLEWALTRVPAPVAVAVLIGGGMPVGGAALFFAAARGVAAFRPRPDEIQL